MKYIKKRQRYESSNCSYDPETCLGLSYDWWAISQRIDGQLYFNDYNYSPSTSRHQRKILEHISDKNCVTVYAPEGLQVANALEKASAYSQSEIDSLEKLEAKGRKGTDASDWRLHWISIHEDTIECLNSKIEEEF
jgi:hypothetical protein